MQLTGKITRDSLMTLEAYSKWRKAHKAEIIAHRKLRSVALGEHITLQFESETTIRYQLARAGRASIFLYDPAGRRVRTLVDDILPPGSHSVTWDGRDGSGRKLASGAYFYELRQEGAEARRRILLLR